MTKMSILIVDDNFSIRKLIESALEKSFNILIARDGNEAFEVLEQKSVDLIILDIMLPDISGYEICSEIKSNTRLKDIPIIMLSAKVGSTSRTTSYRLGAINYIEKPFEIIELKAVIDSTLKSNKSVNASLTTLLNVEIDLLRQLVLINGKAVDFTTSEFKLFSYMFKKPNQVLSRSLLLEVISPSEINVSDRSVDNHISSIRKKILESHLKIKSIYSQGYKLIA